MTWAKLDDNFTDHPKVNEISHGAFRLHVSGLCHASRTLSDGFVSKAWAPRLVPGFKPSFVAELVAARLWDEVENGWQIHDFLDYNPSAAEVKVERELAAQRMRNLRKEKKRSGERAPERAPERSGEQGGERSGERSGPVGANVRGPRPVPSPTDVVTPSLTTKVTGAPEEGGSGSAEEAEHGDDPTGLGAIDALLRKVCPPDKNRLYGAPRSDLRVALRGGADLDLVLAAIRQGQANEGAFLRWDRAKLALASGKVPTGSIVPSKPFLEPAWVNEAPADPTTVAEELAKARAALGR